MFRLASSHLQTLESLKMTRCESKHVAHIVTNIQGYSQVRETF